MSKKPTEAPSSPFNNPFASLEGQKADLPPGRAPAPKVSKGPARAVVRMERKGRGGKEVTVIEKLELKPAELEKWLKTLKQGLGCGGVVEGTDLVLQGDQRERVGDLLTKQGVQKVVLG